MNKNEFLLEIIEHVNRRHNNFDTEVENFHKTFKNKKYLCLFGAGTMLNMPVFYFRQTGIRIDFVCDNDPKKHGKEFYGIKCISYDELKQIKNDTIIFISTAYFIELEEQLKRDAFTDIYSFYGRFIPNYNIKEIFNKEKENIISAFNLLEDDTSKEIYLAHILHVSNSLYYSRFPKIPFSNNQYFDSEIISLSENETFLDIGAYDGEDTIRFVNLVNENFNKIYCFELSNSNFNILNDKFKMLKPSVLERVICVNKGISDNNYSLPYSDEWGTGSCLDSNQNNSTGNIAEIIKLDDFLSNEPVTFIKMDIEGAEYNALVGARNIITKQLPKLAISVYHKIDDLWTIPILIKNYCKDYKIFFRHHCPRSPNETVCYAIPMK